MILTMIEEVMHVIEGDELKVLMIWKNLMIHVIDAEMMSDENIQSQVNHSTYWKDFQKTTISSRHKQCVSFKFYNSGGGIRQQC